MIIDVYCLIFFVFYCALKKHEFNLKRSREF